MSTQNQGRFYLLKWLNDGGDRGEDLFDRPLDSTEQHDYMQEIYGSGSPDTDVSEWISWTFEPTWVIQWPKAGK